MVSGPDPRAALRGFMALLLDMVRVDPDRRASAEMQKWHRELAASAGVLPESALTNRELLDGALRISRALHGAAPEQHDALRRSATMAVGG